MDAYRPVVLIPAFREAATIGRVVTEAVSIAPVLVADDCSDDDTGAVAEAAGATVLRNATSLGYVGSLNALFRAAATRGATHAITMDADGEHDPRHVAEFVDALRDVPLGLGIRPRPQRLAEFVTAAYVRRRHGVADIFCGMKGYDLALAERNGGFDPVDSVGTQLALDTVRRGAPFRQIAVGGTMRVDAPRFGRKWRANMILFGVLRRIIRDDLAGLRPAT